MWKWIWIGLLAWFWLLVAPWVKGEDWLCWRGPEGNGVTVEALASPEKLNETWTVDWRAQLGMGHSTVSVKGDRVYSMGFDTDGVDDTRTFREIVWCLDATTGDEIWKYDYPTEHRRFPGPASTPTIHNGHVFTVGREGKVLCLDAEEGWVVWQKDIADEALSVKPTWGYCSSPVILGDKLLVNAGRSGLALDVNTGRVIWSSEPEMGWLATPRVFKWNGHMAAAIASRQQLFIVNVGNGEVLHEMPWTSQSDPELLQQRLLLTGGQAARASVMLDFSADAPSEVWASRNMSGVFQSSVVVGDYAFGFARGRNDCALQAVHVKTGELAWSETFPDWGGISAAGNHLIIADGTGRLVVAKACSQGYQELASMTAISMRNWKTYSHDEPNTVWTAPVFANQRIYVRSSHGELVCIRTQT